MDYLPYHAQLPAVTRVAEFVPVVDFASPQSMQLGRCPTPGRAMVGVWTVADMKGAWAKVFALKSG
jgi:hypothetical protein